MTTLRPFAVALIFCAASASAAIADDYPQQGLCQAVRSMAAESPVGFADLQGDPWPDLDKPGEHYWHADQAVPGAMTGRLDHCVIRRLDGETRAALHCRAVDIAVGDLDRRVGQCLPDWERTDISDASDTEHAETFIVFEQPGSQTIVMVEGFSEDGVWLGVSEKPADDNGK